MLHSISDTINPLVDKDHDFSSDLQRALIFLQNQRIIFITKETNPKESPKGWKGSREPMKAELSADVLALILLAEGAESLKPLERKLNRGC